MKALRMADKGTGLIKADDFLAGMHQRAQAAQHRIRAAVAVRQSGELDECPVSVYQQLPKKADR
jgi:hypothetical protein